MKDYLLGEAGETHLLLGNEAIVRGALEAGINIVTCYPGTPSSEVPDTFRRLLSHDLFNLEYSVNEKVALEVGAGAALAGAMTLVTMKHVGVNVAADPLLTMTYTGLPGGLLLLSADDPGCHASQNEQDNRYYARFASMPCFEPSSPQEAKDMTKAALLLARETQQPVLLRTTTRVNHMRGPVLYGKMTNGAEIIPFSRNVKRYVPVPAVAKERHKILDQNMKNIQQDYAENCIFNTQSGAGDIGVIASGVSRAYLHDVIASHSWENKIQTLSLGFSWPLPEQKILHFARSVKTLLILEEGEGLLEKDVRALLQRHKLNLAVLGKNKNLSIFGEYSTSKIEYCLKALIQNEEPSGELAEKTPPALPQRPPNLCAGCAHRSVFYAVRKEFGNDAFYSSDIGCYTLGLLPPLSAADFLFCMGSSISAGSGFAKVSKKPVVAFIGDSTFFHSGITGLANAVFNKHSLLLVILDNGTTAMTGHQPNPGVSAELLGDHAEHLAIDTIVASLGIQHIKKIRGYNQKSLASSLQEFKEVEGVRVLIVEEPCVLFARRVLHKKRNQIAYVAANDESSEQCFAEFACQAFVQKDSGVEIDEDLCAGCMVCMQISPSFKARKRESI